MNLVSLRHTLVERQYFSYRVSIDNGLINLVRQGLESYLFSLDLSLLNIKLDEKIF